VRVVWTLHASLTHRLSVIGIYLLGSLFVTPFFLHTGLRQWPDWTICTALSSPASIASLPSSSSTRRTLSGHSENPVPGVSSNPQLVSSPPACRPCVRCS
jgi:integral membrane sensor domain MASE1